MTKKLFLTLLAMFFCFSAIPVHALNGVTGAVYNTPVQAKIQPYTNPYAWQILSLQLQLIQLKDALRDIEYEEEKLNFEIPDINASFFIPTHVLLITVKNARGNSKIFDIVANLQLETVRMQNTVNNLKYEVKLLYEHSVELQDFFTEANHVINTIEEKQGQIMIAYAKNPVHAISLIHLTAWQVRTFYKSVTLLQASILLDETKLQQEI